MAAHSTAAALARAALCKLAARDALAAALAASAETDVQVHADEWFADAIAVAAGLAVAAAVVRRAAAAAGVQVPAQCVAVKATMAAAGAPTL